MAWPSWGPLYTGGIPSIHFDNIERGYQFVDLPLIGVALGGNLAILRSQRELRTALIALGSGFGVFLWTVSIGWFRGRGLWGYAWGYDVTLGGAICLVYVGLFCLSFIEQWPSVAVNQLRASVHTLRQDPL